MIISVTSKRLLKTQIFEKKATFPVKKNHLTAFSLFIEYKNPQKVPDRVKNVL